MKIWIDSKKPAPPGYLRCKSYWSGLIAILAPQYYRKIEVVDIGDDDGDAVEVIGLLSKMGLKYPIRIHSVSPLEIDKLRSAIVGNQLKEIDPIRSICIWLDHELNEPDGLYRLDTVNKVKNCVVWCAQNGWAIGCIDVCEKLEKSREADGGTIEDFEAWLKDCGKYNLFRRH